MPIIRKKPELRTFRHTMLYKETKALCALPANSNRPNDRLSLTRALLRREKGISTHPSGSFTPNLQRRIANAFLPNNKERRLMSLETEVFTCKFTKDGNKLVTACQDSVVRIFDSSKGTYNRIKRFTAKVCNWSVLEVDFSPCGKYLAYSTCSEHVFVLPVDGDERDAQLLNLNTGDTNRSDVFSLRFSPCGQHIIFGCNNSYIHMCDRETHAVRWINTQGYKRADINAICYVSDKDSNVLVSGCNDGIVKLWDLRCASSSSRRDNESGTGSESVFMGHLDGITYIDTRNDGNHILTNSKDQSIKIWDLRMPTPSHKVGNEINLPLKSWDYRLDTVPRGYYNPKTKLDGDVSIMSYRGHRVTESLLRAKFSPAIQTGQRYIYTGCGTGRIIIYDVLTGQIKETIKGHQDIVRDLSWHPVRSEIVSSSWDSHVNLNTFKHNPRLKRRSYGEGYHGSLRRSLRIASRNDEEEESDQSW